MIVIDKNGVQAEIDVTAPPPFDGSGTHLLVRLSESGRRVVVPISALVEREGQDYFLPLDLTELDDAPPFGHEQPIHEVDREQTGGDAVVMPVVAEELRVERRVVETGRVRLTKKVFEREEVIDASVMREEVDVRRVAVNRPVSEPPPVRYEGETMIVPVFEEVLVVEKRLVLREELHITRRRVAERRPQRVTLRSERVEVERLETQGRSDEKADGQETPKREH